MLLVQNLPPCVSQCYITKNRAVSGRVASLGKFLAPWDYTGAYDALCNSLAVRAVGYAIFLRALDWLGQKEFRRKVRALPRRGTMKGQSK